MKLILIRVKRVRKGYAGKHMASQKGLPGLLYG